jgi:regulator of protease activity HflC (stomatin/prohibitin superfamily)
MSNQDEHGRTMNQRSDEQAALARIRLVALGLSAALGALYLTRATPVDGRWCLSLAGAWLNIFTITLGVGAVISARSAPASSPPWPAGVRIWTSGWWTQATAKTVACVGSVRWQPWLALICAGLSILIAMHAWRLFIAATFIGTPRPTAAMLVFESVALSFAFFTLIAERFSAQQASRSSAYASLTPVVRVALLVTLAAAGSVAWTAYTGVTLDWTLRATTAFNAAIAVELASRAAMSWFSPRAGRRTDVSDSLLAGALRPHPSPWTWFGTELRDRYGIDLRQNWVLQSFVRLLPATIVAICASAWLLTGIVIVNPEQRVVYERFGAPVAVWQPGLHLALPWPLGKARVIDNGAVHRLVIAGGPDELSDAEPLVPADGPTPEQLNRLWDVAHEGETTQVIAGASGARQNFQIVNADVRVDYRIGSSDLAARSALYRNVDVATTVRSVANRAVVRYLASHTLGSLLETRQTVMAESVRHVVQQELDRISSGIDVVAVVIESVHPPAGAAAAYHNVQAAQILAQAGVAQAHGIAAGEIGEAEQTAHTVIAKADSQAAETTSAARVQQTDFGAEMSASQVGGKAFAFEYYMHNLEKGLRNARITVIDDRLVDGNRATLDLRPYVPPGDVAGMRRGY